MRRTLAIAVIAVRNAVRSRLFTSLLLLALLAVIGLPLTIEGDGTLRGYTTVLLSYTMGAVFILLSVSTAWAACASMSVELGNRRMDLVVTKPIHPLQIWLGKWLGIMALNAVLLAAAGAATYALLQWKARSVVKPEERRVLDHEIMVTREFVWADDEPIEARARQELARLTREGKLPPNVPPAAALTEIRSQLLAASRSVPPGGVRHWVFRLAHPPRRSEEIRLRFKLASSRQVENTPAAYRWETARDSNGSRWSQSGIIAPNAVREIAIPRSLIGNDRTLALDFVNTETKVPATLMLYPEAGPVLLVPWDRIEWNLLRALGIVFCFLGFFAAIGLTSGALFSLPVSVFVSFAAMLVLSLSGYMHTVVTTGVFYVPHEGGMPEASAVDHAIMGLFKALHLVLGPVTRFECVAPLSEGRLIPWATLGQAFAFLVVLGGGLLWVGGATVLRRREIGAVSE